MRAALLLVAVLAVGSLAAPRLVNQASRSRYSEADIDAYYKQLKTGAFAADPDFFDIMEIPAGFAASMMCSGLFVDNMSEDEVLEFDVDIAGAVVDIYVDYDEKSVTAVGRNTGEPVRKSIYREGVGCIIVFPETTEEYLRSQDLGDQSPLPALNETVEWPLGDYVDPTPPAGVDMDALRAIVQADFDEPRYNTRAVIVVYKGKIVHEQYKPGMGRNNRFLGWSMTKSVNAALVGIQTGLGNLKLDGRIPVPEWDDPNDARHNITVRNLLNMASGLQWLEGLNVPQGLYMAAGDIASYAANMRLRDPINTVFEYSTGTSTILARTVQEVRDDDGLVSFEYPRAALFSKLGMTSAIIEHHVPGYHLGGSNMHASARDWARFGQLYMRDGVWADGKRILPEGWVDFTCTPSDAYGGYGAQWWISSSPEANTCRMSGFRGQSVHTMKEKDLMVVRLSMPRFIFTGAHETTNFVRSIWELFP